ncbi:hypothetical protein EAG_11208 [Camponotus floridanus]|uniref:Uncharacterized protein n=1 Tax=Camponotus floridanus TaxID=104421 RepID=E2A0L4_CAMFO|nr:hypothetical protein EAG_11208 [Camponotus floridanus]
MKREWTSERGSEDAEEATTTSNLHDPRRSFRSSDLPEDVAIVLFLPLLLKISRSYACRGSKQKGRERSSEERQIRLLGGVRVKRREKNSCRRVEGIDIAIAKEEGRSEYGAAVPRHNNRAPHTAELADDFIELGPLGLRAQDLPETASNYNAGSDPGPLLMDMMHSDNERHTPLAFSLRRIRVYIRLVVIHAVRLEGVGRDVERRKVPSAGRHSVWERNGLIFAVGPRTCSEPSGSLGAPKKGAQDPAAK